MKFCEPFEVSSSNDLICKLHSYDTSVPQRGQGLKTEHTERWVTCRFLRAIADTPLLSYPLRVESRDKPDLVLEIKTREPKQIGIEITEAVSQVYANLKVNLVQSGDSTGIHHVPENKFSDQRLPKNEFKKLSEEFQKINEGKKYPRPIMGDAIEQNWKEAILGTAKKKVDAFNKSCFKCYRNNWLLIYDNWSPAPPSCEVQGLTKELSQFLFPNDWQQPFDRVFVLSSEIMWEFREDVIPISYRVTTPG